MHCCESALSAAIRSLIHGQLPACTKFQQQELADSCGWNDRCMQIVTVPQPVQSNERLTAATFVYM